MTPSEKSDSGLDVFPPGQTVVLQGYWRIEIEDDGVRVSKEGTLYLRPGETTIENHARIDINRTGLPSFVSDQPGPLWIPWYGVAALAGALAPYILKALPPPAE